LPLKWAEQADVAQLVEQLIRNQQVNGSSPFVGSSFPQSTTGCESKAKDVFVFVEVCLNLIWFEISTEIMQDKVRGACWDGARAAYSGAERATLGGCFQPERQAP
jgi:hypothetical protein